MSINRKHQSKVVSLFQEIPLKIMINLLKDILDKNAEIFVDFFPHYTMVDHSQDFFFHNICKNLLPL
jgi:hypothetical protein